MNPVELPHDDERRIAQAHQERIAIALARLGWINPIWIRPAEAEELLGDGDPDEVDAAFISLYSGDGFARYERIMREMPQLQGGRWRALIEQMDTAYRREHYAIVVPAAFVLLEAILTRDRTVFDNVRASVRDRIPGPPIGYSLHRVMWLAASEFVELIYARHDFDGDAPLMLNRHWVLHGRSQGDWSQADALRLIQACYVAWYLALNAS